MKEIQLLIILLLVIAVSLMLILQRHYFWQVGFMRIFFAPSLVEKKPINLTANISNVVKIPDIKYTSVLGREYLDLYYPGELTEKSAVLFWVHGGGYISGDKNCINEWAREIAARCKIKVIGVNYKTAPEQHYPVPVVQTGEAIKFMLGYADKYGLDKNKIFLAGDSAGAQIVSQYAAIVTNPSLKDKMCITPAIKPCQLLGIALFCGFYNMDTVLKTHFPGIKTFLWAYTNCKKSAKFSRRDEMSTIKNITKNYPDTFITCGNKDKFHSEAVAFSQALIAEGIVTDAVLNYSPTAKLSHEYQFNLLYDSAQLALNRFSEFILARIL